MADKAKLTINRVWEDGENVHVHAYEIVRRSGNNDTDQYTVTIPKATAKKDRPAAIAAALKEQRDAHLAANPPMADLKASDLGLTKDEIEV